MGARGRKSKAQLMVVQSESPAQAAPARSSSTLPPPADLGAAGKELWRQITSEFTLESSAEVQQFYQACCMTDRAVKLRKHIDREGEMVEIRGTRRDHPCLKHELGARAFVVRTLANLFPSAAAEKPPRYRSSPGYYGQAGSR
jgi:hypothetical protein